MQEKSLLITHQKSIACLKVECKKNEVKQKKENFSFGNHSLRWWFLY